jgi:hypothetical protein
MYVRNIIVRVIPYRTIKTCLLIRELPHESLCEGEPFREIGVSVRIERVHCWHPLPLKQIWNGCCYVPCPGADHEPEPCSSSVIEYPAFERDSEGRICFYWDKLLYSQPPGRYNAAIRHGDKTLLGFGLQLEAAPLMVEQVSTVEALPECDTGECGG